MVNFKVTGKAILKNLKLSILQEKKIAIFGLGDQLGYDEWFCDGLGILGEVVIKGGGKLIGYTQKDDSYDFETSLALADEETFYGLAIDEDNQQELTEGRLRKWVIQIKEEFNK